MFPDLSYILHFLIGTEPDNWTSIFKTFGLLLVLAILSAAWTLHYLLKKKAEKGIFKPEKVKVKIGEPASIWDLVSNGFFGFILGFKGVYVFQNFAEFQADPASVVLSSKGVAWAGIAGALIFAAIRWWEKKKDALPKPKEVTQMLYPHDKIGDVTIVAAICGIVGARLFSILEEPSVFFSDPIGTLFSGSGLTIYGGLILGFIGVLWWLKKHKIPTYHFLDCLAIAYVIAYGVGRMGCQLAGDGDWGIVAAAIPEWWFLPDWLWAYAYPNNVNNAGELMALCDSDCWSQIVSDRTMSIEMKCQQCCGVNYCHELNPPVYPTPIYETVASFLTAGILYWLSKKFSTPGMIFYIYLIFNGIERFFVEKIRVNVTYDLMGSQITQAEIISVVLFIIGIIGSVMLWQKSKKSENQNA